MYMLMSRIEGGRHSLYLIKEPESKRAPSRSTGRELYALRSANWIPNLGLAPIERESRIDEISPIGRYAA